MTISTTTGILTSALLLASSTAVFAEEGDMIQTRDRIQDGTMEHTQTRTQDRSNADFDLYTPDASSLQALNREQSMTRNQHRYMNAAAGSSMSENSAKMGNGTGNMQSRQGQTGQSMQSRTATRSMNNTTMNTYRNNSMTRSTQGSTQGSAASGSMTQQNTASRSMSGGRR